MTTNNVKCGMGNEGALCSDCIIGKSIKAELNHSFTTSKPKANYSNFTHKLNDYPTKQTITPQSKLLPKKQTLG
jgi:hypothetical protein